MADGCKGRLCGLRVPETRTEAGAHPDFPHLLSLGDLRSPRETITAKAGVVALYLEEESLKKTS